MSNRSWLFVAWLLALVATAGSLFFSEVMKLPPCVLCWYQRIAIYPMTLLLPIFWFYSERRASVYLLPLGILGFLIAVYHNLLYYKIIPENLTPCTEGISCTSRQIEWLGFITIPLLSLVTFILVNACLGIFAYQISREEMK